MNKIIFRGFSELLSDLLHSFILSTNNNYASFNYDIKASHLLLVPRSANNDFLYIKKQMLVGLPAPDGEAGLGLLMQQGSLGPETEAVDDRIKEKGGGSIKLNPREGVKGESQRNTFECPLHLQRPGVGKPGERSTRKRALQKKKRRRIDKRVPLGQVESDPRLIIPAGQFQSHLTWVQVYMYFRYTQSL